MAMSRACINAGFDLQRTFRWVDSALKGSGLSLASSFTGRGLLKRLSQLRARDRRLEREYVKRVSAPSAGTLLSRARAQVWVDQLLAEYFPEGIHGRKKKTLFSVCLSLVRTREKWDTYTPDQLRALDSVYPGTLKRWKARKAIPLPSTLWKSWTDRYQWIRQMMLASSIIDPGWVTRGPHSGYCPRGAGVAYREKSRGICRSYRVNLPSV